MVLLAACGFEPLHGRQQSGSDTSTELSKIAVPPIPDRLGQMLRIELTNQLTPKGQPRAPLYVLTVSVNENKQDLAIRKDATATRANLTITATFSLTDKKTNKSVFNGSLRSVNSYNIIDADFATLTAENDARRRGVRVLATEIGLRLGVFLSQPT